MVVSGAFLGDDGRVGVVLDFMDRGDLSDLIQETVGVPEDTIVAIGYQV